MNYTLKTYITKTGKEPIKIWLNSLSPTIRKRILMRLMRVENGNFGDHKQLSSSLFELRFKFGSGYRIYYTIKNNTIILLISGGDKKTQSEDIEKANEILKTI